jgi:enoyl-CoA hydratase/carnithine racemase
MTQSSTIMYEVNDHIATITLNRPDRLNALLPDMGPHYADLLRRADADPDVRAIIVTGAGRGFCSGADLEVLMQGSDALQGYLSGQRPEALPTVAFGLQTPVITAINGPCAGIGFVMALCADVRFASRTATLSSSFARLGLIAEYGSAWILPRLIGLPAATEILLTGRTLNAQEALTLGLVHEVSEDAYVSARAWASALITHSSPTSMGVIKHQLLAGSDQTLTEAVEGSLALMAESFTRSDLAEALTARMEKRAPNFSDRKA